MHVATIRLLSRLPHHTLWTHSVNSTSNAQRRCYKPIEIVAIPRLPLRCPFNFKVKKSFFKRHSSHLVPSFPYFTLKSALYQAKPRDSKAKTLLLTHCSVGVYLPLDLAPLRSCRRKFKGRFFHSGIPLSLLKEHCLEC